ncbi:hypothetical protein D3C87_1276230 [compost metagenome]
MNSLSRLNDFELEASLKDLVFKERKLLHVILEHIKEVDNRKLYLERAYSSLYEYLVKELNYSGSAAMRRIEAARLLKDIPMIREKIHDGSLNLSQIGELSKAIKEKEKTIEGRVSSVQKAELVEVISGKTTQETQRDLAQVLNIEIKLHETKRVQQDESLRCELTLSKRLAEKIKRCKERASYKIHKMDDGHTLAALIEVLADAFLKDDLVSEAEEAEIMQDESLNSKSKVAAVEKSNSDLNAATFDNVMQMKVTKTLTPKMKREVFHRDKCCKYVDPITGRQCGSFYFQQIDHKTSQWAGGNHAKSNLQVLCAGHNRLKYQKESQIRLL